MAKSRSPESSQLKLDELSPRHINSLCRVVINCTSQLFDEPGEKERYKSWKQNHRQLKQTVDT